ncbi:ABC transporter ATP-binding protein [Nonomuraea sp. NBC_01738]|uniref:ABC transporter ATP-binding protein n=1 Tax=Nonomuraea sp. NBC_01738 TaxID=2976003 RepID=UPI002E10DEBE|nr:ABC transporter ATP-binding protein [Nonomuraea sp. NBC_01738]
MTLEAVDVSKHFPGGVRAVEHVSLRLEPGRIVGLVGESGSGKTTLARMLALFHPPTSGHITLNGQPVKNARDYHKHVQLIFQDPFSSLNNLRTIGYTIGRALRLHRGLRRRTDVEAAATDLLQQVNLGPDVLAKLPHELSGGQRQRVVIARALAVGSSVLLADEPISMLDVSIRLDILNLLAGLRERHQLSILYITHDIASARYLCDDICVMYGGRMVEAGPAEQVIQHPRHPYTRLLLDCAPDPSRPGGILDDDLDYGEPPSLSDPPPGCRFQPRCPQATPECATQPPRADFPSGQWADCWLHH